MHESLNDVLYGCNFFCMYVVLSERPNNHTSECLNVCMYRCLNAWTSDRNSLRMFENLTNRKELKHRVGSMNNCS